MYAMSPSIFNNTEEEEQVYHALLAIFHISTFRTANLRYFVFDNVITMEGKSSHFGFISQPVIAELDIRILLY